LNDALFITFLMRLLRNRQKKVFLVVDIDRVDQYSDEILDYVESVPRKLTVFFLPHRLREDEKSPQAETRPSGKQPEELQDQALKQIHASLAVDNAGVSPEQEKNTLDLQ
jgi:hypothetical protein